MTDLPKRVLVIGLDGADPRFCAEMMDEGRLPAMAALRERGVFGDLASTIPPVSAPAWSTFMTGRDPGGHGVYGFVEEDGAGGFRLMSLASVEGTKLWEAAGEKRVGVMNVPVTFPMPKVNGVFASGMLTPPGRPYTEPPELQARIEEIAPAYAPDIDRSLFGDPEALYAHLLDLVDARGEAFLDVYRSEPWDLFACVFTETDRVQHHFWRDQRDRIKDFFDRVDEQVGRLVEAAGDDTLVLIMSDHGFVGTDRRFYANQWLREAGYLKLKRVREDTDDYEDRRFTTHLGETQKEEPAPVPAKRNLLDRMAWMFGIGSRRAIDWSKTQAYLYSASSHGIEINLKGRQPEGIVEGKDYDDLRDEMIEKLKALTYPDSAEHVFSRVLRREEAYFGPHIARAPDIVLCPTNDRYRIVTHPAAKSPFRQHKRAEGYHGETGLLFLAGPGVVSGASTEAGLADVMPTVLWALDVGIPESVDGSVLFPLLSAGAEEARPVRTVEDGAFAPTVEPTLTAEEEEALKDSLRGLGYL
ncbi:MAG: alkaline phosphatase family protein [Planctomycetota bacterium]